MSFLRDFLRDFIGILFPGGFILIVLIWFIMNISFVLCPEFTNFIYGFYNNWIVIFILIAFSYIAGQLFRMKHLYDIEEICTESYRKEKRKNFKKNKKKLEESDFEAVYKELERKYELNKDKKNIEKLHNEFIMHHKKFGIWEKFPYPYYLKFWRITRHAQDYNKFFYKFDKQGITKERAFFHFCKNVIYEYSASFKEELVRQESLIRLFSGLFYSIRFSQLIIGAIAIEHLVLILFNLIGLNIPVKLSINISCFIAFISVFLIVLFRYIYSEIIKRMRFMRVKELQIAYDSFYIICKKENLSY